MSEEKELTPEELLESLRAAKDRLSGIQEYIDATTESEETEATEDVFDDDIYLTVEKAHNVLEVTRMVLDQVVTAGMLSPDSPDEAKALVLRILAIHGRILSHLEK